MTLLKTFTGISLTEITNRIDSWAGVENYHIKQFQVSYANSMFLVTILAEKE